MKESDKILLDLLDQYTCSMIDDNLPNRTQYNAEAIAVMYLENLGLVKRIEGKFPETKFITFKIL